MPAYTSNFNLYKPNRADTLEVDTTLSANFETVDAELKNRKDEIEAHKASTIAHESINIKHGDGNVQQAIVEIGSQAAKAYERVEAVIRDGGDSNIEIADARDQFPTLRDRFENAETLLAQNVKKIGLKSKAEITHLFDYSTGDVNYNRAQGMCITDKYIVCAITNGVDTDNTRLYVFDKTTYALVSGLTANPITDRSFGHANSLTYNSKTNQILIAGITNQLWVLNADTFATVQTITMPYTCLGVAYDSVNDQYVVDQGNFTYHIVSNTLQEKSSFTIPDTGLTKQGIECYNELIFIPFYDGGAPNSYQSGGSADTAYSSMVFVFSLKGDLIQSYMLGQLGEIEELSYYDGRFIANFNQDGTTLFFALSLFPQYKYTTKEQLIKANNELTGYETNLKSGDDLNNIKTPGNYRINGSGLGGLLLNYPTGFNGKLKVEYIQNNTYILQTVTARDNHIWTRVYDPTGSGWSVWKPLTPDDDTGWIALTLSGTFSSAGAGNTGVYYRKIGNRVRWKGNISNSAWTSGAWVTLTTLPVGVRPLQDLYFTTGSNANNMVTINVTSTGAVSLWAASATNFNVGLNMIQFDLD